MAKNNQVRITYHPKQHEIFFGSTARVKIIPKGRRFGLTRGLANYALDRMFDGNKKILWVDTVNGNIDRYVERYFYPVLNDLDKTKWNYKQQRKELTLGTSYCDFRSADKPETIEGFGYHIIIINEAGIVLKNDYIWNNAILPMALDYRAEMLVGGTPKGKRNKRTNKEHLFYTLYKRAQSDKTGEWQLFQYSSYDNPILSKTDIDELKQDIPPALREQEIEGHFIDDISSDIIKRDWWQYCDSVPFHPMAIIDSWDTAFKDKEENDYSVRTTWAVTKNGFYLIDCFRDRLTFPALNKQAINDYYKNRANEVIIEDKASGISLIQVMQSETNIPIKAIKKDKDKVTYAHAVTPLFESGKVFILNNQPWTSTVIDECADFPNGEFDDIVDSVTQALNYLKFYIPRVEDEIGSLSLPSITMNY